MTPRISVALCTFNGESFLPDQLKSLRNQSRGPDELVVCDDGSTDQTIDILNQFAGSAPFPVHITQNKTTVGPAQNFAGAIAACTGDVISLCDQDDIWEPQKLQLTQTAFEQNPMPSFVFSDAEVCDQACQPLGYRLWTSVGFVGRLRRRFEQGGAFDVLLRQNIVTGATLSFASRFRSLILPIPGPWMHDGWIALLLSAVAPATASAPAKAIPNPLIRYRQHPSQSIGAARRSLYQQYQNAKLMDRHVFAEQAAQYDTALARLQEQTDYEIAPELIHHLQQKIHHSQARSAIRLRQTPRLSGAMTELITGRYARFSLGWKSLAQDLFL